ncbi:MAG: hypothetical protein LBU46_00485 [Candidatus Accumulibacter sp.]|jgi:hypothetical protein|nr:hypothetical protein [Accumulibacter sp.]
MPHPALQPVPQAEPQAVGLLVPQALLLDTRLKPMDRNAWMVFRSLADGNGIATVGYESLRTALLCAPGSQKAAPATVSRAVLCLRLTAWIDQIGYRRDAAAYLFGLIRKALQGTFRLWAARKNMQERPASRVQEAPRETPNRRRHPECPSLSQWINPLPGKWH